MGIPNGVSKDDSFLGDPQGYFDFHAVLSALGSEIWEIGGYFILLSDVSLGLGFCFSKSENGKERSRNIGRLFI